MPRTNKPADMHTIPQIQASASWVYECTYLHFLGCCCAAFFNGDANRIEGVDAFVVNAPLARKNVLGRSAKERGGGGA
jgi:hypothetical protein